MAAPTSPNNMNIFHGQAPYPAPVLYLGVNPLVFNYKFLDLSPALIDFAGLLFMSFLLSQHQQNSINVSPRRGDCLFFACAQDLQSGVRQNRQIRSGRMYAYTPVRPLLMRNDFVAAIATCLWSYHCGLQALRHLTNAARAWYVPVQNK